MGEFLSAHTASQLAAWGVSMRGSIRSRQRCPHCQARGQFELKDFGRGVRALVCQCGQFWANRLEVMIRWRGFTHLIRYDQTGQRLTDYIHAERVHGEINNQLERGAFYPELWASAKANKLLWDNYLSDYLDREAKRLLPERAATMSKKLSLARHLAWFNGRNLREIRTGDLEDFAALPCLALALAPKTRKDLVEELRHIFRRAVARDELERLPEFPAVEVPEAAIAWLMPETQDTIIACIPPEHRPIFAFMMTYAVRPSEACALCWDKIDRQGGCFYLTRTFSRRLLMERTKTRRADVLPIGREFTVYLESMAPGIGKAPVFRNPLADRRRNPEQFYLLDFLEDLWARAVQEAGAQPIKLYNATRHSRGMQALNLEGWGIEAVRSLLRHTSERHTRRYARAEMGLVRRIIDRERVVPLIDRQRKDRP